jgi:hypothetical protein
MTIKKGSLIKVTTIDGATHPARATKVAPFKSGALSVCWISLDGQWKGKSKIENCHMLTDQEIVAATPAVAPTHATMSSWAYGKEKRGPMMMEGYYFASPIYFNGKRVGQQVDYGNGGAMEVECGELNAKFYADCLLWEMANHKNDKPCEPHANFYEWWHDHRPRGITAAEYFKASEIEMAKMLAGH